MKFFKKFDGERQCRPDANHVADSITLPFTWDPELRAGQMVALARHMGLPHPHFFILLPLPYGAIITY